MSEFLAGLDAGFRGDDPRTCPHEPMTRASAAWQRGLTCACLAVLADAELDEHLGESET